MNIQVLIENTASSGEFAAEHGLSLYIETKKHKLLFDTGATGAFADNARKMGVDLTAIDLCVLSHGHYDHGGGIPRFLAENDHAPVYISPYVFGQYYNASGKYIGLDPALEGNPRLVPIFGDVVLDEELEIFSCCGRALVEKVDSAGLTEIVGKTHVPDRFCHEQYLQITENGKKILISGCSHKGILNIMSWTHPDVLIGGFHFMKKVITENGCADLDHAARELLKYPTRYYTCHCTGTEQYRYLKERMGDVLSAISSGDSFTI